jgi:prepilin-type N-terminal cleavage/methylation domain-containing protein
MKCSPPWIATREPTWIRRARRKPRGLTLVELTVALAVLGLLVLALAQATEHASKTVFSGAERMQCDQQAQAIFERISADLRGIPARSDIDLVFKRQPGNDALYFIAEAPAYFIGDPNAALRSPLALMGYWLGEDATLLRLSKGLTWEGAPGPQTGGAPVFLTAPAPTQAPISESTLVGRWPRALEPATGAEFQGADVHPLNHRVIRFEYCFELRPKPGSASVPAFSNQTAPPGRPAIQSIRALRIAVVLRNAAEPRLDPATLASLFPDPTDADLAETPPRLMASVWEENLWTAVRTGTLSNGAGIRIYERRVPLGGVP